MNKLKREAFMLNIIWPIFLIISFVYAILTGRLEQVNASIFEGTKSAVELCVNLLGTMCLWNGIMKIASKTNIVKKLTKLISPIMTKLFPDIKKQVPFFRTCFFQVTPCFLFWPFFRWLPGPRRCSGRAFCPAVPRCSWPGAGSSHRRLPAARR